MNHKWSEKITQISTTRAERNMYPLGTEETYQQKQRRNNKWKIDQDRADTEIVVFGIKTRDENNDIHTKEYDNNQVIKLLKELKRGGFILKTGVIIHTIRQVRNDRHPDEIPITVTLATKELVVEILEAARNSENQDKVTKRQEE